MSEKLDNASWGVQQKSSAEEYTGDVMGYAGPAKGPAATEERKPWSQIIQQKYRRPERQVQRLQRLQQVNSFPDFTSIVESQGGFLLWESQPLCGIPAHATSFFKPAMSGPGPGAWPGWLAAILTRLGDTGPTLESKSPGVKQARWVCLCFDPCARNTAARTRRTSGSENHDFRMMPAGWETLASASLVGRCSQDDSNQKENLWITVPPNIFWEECSKWK